MDPGAIGGVAAGLLTPIVLAYLRRAGRTVIPHQPAADMREPNARLCERGWFYRKFVVRVDGREYRLDYDGGGHGERVFVDGKQVASAASLTSLTPSINFLVAGHRGLIEVDARWLVVIKGFRLTLDDTRLYSEGSFSG